jgi:tetratricopeptide (TPR) repeat protein
LKRTLLELAMAAILVAAIAVGASFFASGNEPGRQTGGSSPGPTVAPTPSVLQPSAEMWGDLLPKLEAVAAAAPDDVNLQRKLALAYYNLGRYDEAATIYQRLLAAKEDAVLRDRLGNTLRDKGDAAGAEAAYRQAIKDHLAQPSPYLNLAELLWRQGKDQDALAIIDEGLGHVSGDGRATLEQGREQLQAGSRQ